MPEYRYTALDASGKKNRGTRQAASSQEVVAHLRSQGMVPVEIATRQPGAPARTGPFFRRGARPLRPSRASRARTRDIVFFTRQFSTMLSAGLNVTASLEALKRQPGGTSIRDTLAHLQEKTTQGESLTQALQDRPDALPLFLVRMIEVGELTGNLDEIMGRMADFYEREYEVAKKIRGALIYPLMILGVTLLMMVFILTYVLPNFVQMFEASQVPLPGITRALLGASENLSAYGPLYLAGLALAALLIRAWARTGRGRELAGRLKLSLPLFGKHYRMILTSRFARTMQILLGSGITITNALEITARVLGNPLARTRVLAVREEVSAGRSFGDALDETGLFPSILISMIEVGETSGSLDGMLQRASAYYDREMEYAVNQAIRLIEPLAILVVALLVGTAIFAVLLPMLDMVTLY